MGCFWKSRWVTANFCLLASVAFHALHSCRTALARKRWKRSSSVQFHTCIYISCTMRVVSKLDGSIFELHKDGGSVLFSLWFWAYLPSHYCWACLEDFATFSDFPQQALLRLGIERSIWNGPPFQMVRQCKIFRHLISHKIPWSAWVKAFESTRLHASRICLLLIL